MTESRISMLKMTMRPPRNQYKKYLNRSNQRSVSWLTLFFALYNAFTHQFIGGGVVAEVVQCKSLV